MSKSKIVDIKSIAKQFVNESYLYYIVVIKFCIELLNSINYITLESLNLNIANMTAKNRMVISNFLMLDTKEKTFKIKYLIWLRVF